MSRLTDLGEILEGYEGRSGPKTQWVHRYDFVDDHKIHGSFTYRDEENILKVSYTASIHNIIKEIMQNAYNPGRGLTQILENNAQARLSKKENKDMLEAMVESESNEMYQKQNLVPYIRLLNMLCAEIEKNEEDEDFKPYKNRVVTEIKKIIDKLAPAYCKNDDTDSKYGSASPATQKYNTIIKKEIKNRQELMNQNIQAIDTSGSMPAPKQGIRGIIRNAAASMAIAAGSILGYDFLTCNENKESKEYTQKYKKEKSKIIIPKKEEDEKKRKKQ